MISWRSELGEWQNPKLSTSPQARVGKDKEDMFGRIAQSYALGLYKWLNIFGESGSELGLGLDSGNLFAQDACLTSTCSAIIYRSR